MKKTLSTSTSLAMRTAFCFLTLFLFFFNAHAEERKFQDLPSLKKLSTNPAWSDHDSFIATKLIANYLTAYPGLSPTDCVLKLSAPVSGKYSTFQTRSIIEKQLDQKFLDYVMFEQTGLWQGYTSPEVQISKDKKKAWKSFLRFDKNELEPYATNQYQQNQRRVEKLWLRDMSPICSEVKKFLAKKYKIEPQHVTCLPENTPKDFDVTQYSQNLGGEEFNYTQTNASWSLKSKNGSVVSAYKYDSPFANGYRYRNLQLISCTFAKQNVPKDGDYRLRPNEQIENGQTITTPDLQRTSKITTPAQAENENTPPSKTFSKIARKVPSTQKEPANNKKQFQNSTTIQSEKFANRPENPNKSPSGSDNGFSKEFKKLHDDYPTDQEKNDYLKKRDELLKKALATEQAQLDQNHLNNPDSKNNLKLLSVSVDPDRPFNRRTFEIPTEIDPENLDSYLNEFLAQYGTFLTGCKSYTLIKAHRSYIECLQINLIAKYSNPNPNPKISFRPKLERIKKVPGKTLNCAFGNVGAKNSKLILTQKAIFRPSEKKFDQQYLIEERKKNVPVDLEITLSLKGQVFDALTKKPILNAKAQIQAMNQQSALTTTEGTYQFNSIKVKRSKIDANFSHPRYETAKAILPVSYGKENEQAPIYLEPKRVTITGKLTPKFIPRAGTQLQQVIVKTPDETIVSTVAPDGTFTLKNVPATITEIQISDPTHHIEDQTSPITINSDQMNDQGPILVTPITNNLNTKVVNKINGRPIAGVKVYIKEYPEISSVSDINGNITLADIPSDLDHAVLVVEQNTALEILSSEHSYSSLAKGKTQIIKNIEILKQTSDVEGYVLDLNTRKGIPGVDVAITDMENQFHAVTDANGFYKFIKVPESAVSVKAFNAPAIYVEREVSRTIDPKVKKGYDSINQNIYLLSEDYMKDRIVVILSWGSMQPDLDTMVVVKQPYSLNDFIAQADRRQLILYSADNNLRDDRFAGMKVDKDDTSYGGREITYIDLKNDRTLIPYKSYDISANQFKNIGLKYKNISAKAEVYIDGKLVATVRPEDLKEDEKSAHWHIGYVINKEFTEINKIQEWRNFNSGGWESDSGDFGLYSGHNESNITK